MHVYREEGGTGAGTDSRTNGGTENGTNNKPCTEICRLTYGKAAPEGQTHAIVSITNRALAPDKSDWIAEMSFAQLVLLDEPFQSGVFPPHRICTSCSTASSSSQPDASTSVSVQMLSASEGVRMYGVSFYR